MVDGDRFGNRLDGAGAEGLEEHIHDFVIAEVDLVKVVFPKRVEVILAAHIDHG